MIQSCSSGQEKVATTLLCDFGRIYCSCYLSSSLRFQFFSFVYLLECHGDCQHWARRSGDVLSLMQSLPCYKMLTLKSAISFIVAKYFFCSWMEVSYGKLERSGRMEWCVMFCLWYHNSHHFFHLEPHETLFASKKSDRIKFSCVSAAVSSLVMK